MYLIIDLGNTLAKCYVTQQGKLLLETKLEGHDFDGVRKFIADLDQPVEAAILSSVVDHPASLERALKECFFTVVLDHTTPLPFKNSYQTPQTLGKDRLAAAAGALQLYPGANVLAIDAGTCIKYDVVTGSGEYLGGGISPGIEMRFRALNTFTDKLPLLHRADKAELIGRTTEGSIRSGVQNGALEEVKGIISCYSKELGKLKTVITGGDMGFFTRLISEKNAIFADPYLALKGLNFILKHNASKKI